MHKMPEWSNCGLVWLKSGPMVWMINHNCHCPVNLFKQHDANQPMFRGINVWEKPIDLSALQGDLVTFIVEADDELFGCWSHRL